MILYSTIQDWHHHQILNGVINNVLGGLQSVEMVIYSLNFGDVQQVGWPNAFELLLKTCKELEKSDVDGIVLCANTAHLFTDDIQEQINQSLIL
ncbi:hypothetical protein [Zunongwangia sp.]|uniref:hypothetical protein n=1 Tax=Zunongwangia sp. TaxID=1965325 RepID=UPI003AA8981C